MNALLTAAQLAADEADDSVMLTLWNWSEGDPYALNVTFLSAPHVKWTFSRELVEAANPESGEVMDVGEGDVEIRYSAEAWLLVLKGSEGIAGFAFDYNEIRDFLDLCGPIIPLDITDESIFELLDRSL